MFPGQFEYHRPGTVQEAIALLASDPDAKLIAGGHFLLPAMKMRLAMPSSLVDLGRVPGLNGIAVNGNVVIGAMTTYHQLETSGELAAAVPLLHSASAIVGDAQVRTRGTLGGSLAHSDPAADLTAIFLALNGSVKAVGSSGERVIAADDLFLDLLTTSLAPDEIITEVHLPLQGETLKGAYEKIEHPASGYAVVGVAVAVEVGGDGTVASARIAVTGCTSKATRATAAEAALVGKKLDVDGIASAAAVAAQGLEINGDHYASAEYRARLVKGLVKRAVLEAASRASA